MNSKDGHVGVGGHKDLTHLTENKWGSFMLPIVLGLPLSIPSESTLLSEMWSTALRFSLHSCYVSFHLTHVGLPVVCLLCFLSFHWTRRGKGWSNHFKNKSSHYKHTWASNIKTWVFVLSLFWGGGVLLVIFLVFVVERTGGLASGLGAVRGRTAGLVTVWGKELPSC